MGTFVTCAHHAAGLRWPYLRDLRLVFPLLIIFVVSATAASKPHVISLDKPTSVKLLLEPSEQQSVGITVRPLYLENKLKQYTTGPVHDITDLVFVIRRAYQVNDSPPTESSAAATLVGQRGGWLLIDRNTGRIRPIKLLDFDLYYSDVS